MTELFDDHIPLLRPWLGEEEVEAVADVIRSGWIALGSKTAEFEEAVAEYAGVKYAAATNSCTTALHLALRLSGIEYGDEIIIPSFTCMASANAIHMAGATPVFADIEPRTFNLDPESVERSITPNTKGILAVHQIGLPVEIDQLQAIAKRRGLVLIEDGACTLGAEYKGRKVGSLGSPTAYSFHPRKMITTGEGGMIVSDDAEFIEKAKMLRSTGASISDLVRHQAKGTLIQEYQEYGYNYRLTDMQAALGLVQLRKIDKMLEERRSQARKYDEALADIEFLTPPYVPPHMVHSYSSYLVTLDSKAPISRDDLLNTMAAHGISCRIGIQPLHHEPVYAKRFGDLNLPHTEAAAKSTIFLPIFPGLTQENQERIISVLRTAVLEFAR